jgi:hypothetical protein
VRRFKPGTHAGLLLVRLREPVAHALASRIQAVAQEEGLDSFTGCFAVLTDRKLRIRRAVQLAHEAYDTVDAIYSVLSPLRAQVQLQLRDGRRGRTC